MMDSLSFWSTFLETSAISATSVCIHDGPLAGDILFPPKSELPPDFEGAFGDDTMKAMVQRIERTVTASLAVPGSTALIAVPNPRAMSGSELMINWRPSEICCVADVADDASISEDLPFENGFEKSIILSSAAATKGLIARAAAAPRATGLVARNLATLTQRSVIVSGMSSTTGTLTKRLRPESVNQPAASGITTLALATSPPTNPNAIGCQIRKL
mmetsp:Transcript_32431/g.78948  ORF Transcript_32431/g.78948 Transcript_32431/m.78948 type:complete len:216 (-) Transcript_32431:1165-1812(-)